MSDPNNHQTKDVDEIVALQQELMHALKAIEDEITVLKNKSTSASE